MCACPDLMPFALLWLLPKCRRQDVGLGGSKVAFSCSHPQRPPELSSHPGHAMVWCCPLSVERSLDGERRFSSDVTRKSLLWCLIFPTDTQGLYSFSALLSSEWLLCLLPAETASSHSICFPVNLLRERQCPLLLAPGETCSAAGA